MEAGPGLAANASPGASPIRVSRCKHARVLHTQEGRKRWDAVPVRVPDRRLFDSRSTATERGRSANNGSVPRTRPFLPDVLWPVTGKPTRRAHTEGAKTGEQKEKPTKRWAESISRGDMEETEVSINPYPCNASVCIAAATFISPTAPPTAARTSQARHTTSAPCCTRATLSFRYVTRRLPHVRRSGNGEFADKAPLRPEAPFFCRQVGWRSWVVPAHTRQLVAQYPSAGSNLQRTWRYDSRLIFEPR